MGIDGLRVRMQSKNILKLSIAINTVLTMKTFLFIVSLFYVSQVVADDDIQQLGILSNLPSSTLLLTSDNEPLTVIKSEPLITDDSLIARGEQDVTITIDPAANVDVVINNVIFSPGDTKTIKFNVDPFGGALYLPIYTLNEGVGTAKFTLDIPQIKGVWCIPEFKVVGDHCERFTSEVAGWDCPSNNYTIDLGVRSCTHVDIQPPNDLCDSGWSVSGSQCRKVEHRYANAYCSSGYYNGGSCVRTITSSNRIEEECPSGKHLVGGLCYTRVTWVKPSSYDCGPGYTYGKWGSGWCTDTRAYTANKDDTCNGGGSPWWDTKHYICTYQSPHYFSAPYECPANLVGSTCVSGSGSSPTLTCSGSYHYNGYTCEKTITTSPDYSCSAGWTLTGSYCQQTLYTPQNKVGCPDGYTIESSTQCKLVTVVDASPSCPALYAYNAETDLCERTETEPYIPL